MQLKGELAGPLSQLQETSRSIAEVQRECKLEVDTDQYVESFKPFLMDVINSWSKVRIQSYRESPPLDNICRAVSACSSDVVSAWQIAMDAAV